MNDINYLDVLTYINKYVFEALLAGMGISIVAGITGCLFVMMITDFVSDKDLEKSLQKRCKIVLFVSLLIILPTVSIVNMLPTHKRILYIKIQKIKNEIVTDENIKNTTDYIQKTVRKLECKYLECKK